MRAMTREEYGRLSTEQLVWRYRDLCRDTSTENMEQELGRQFALQEISQVLIERGEKIPQ